MFNVPIKGQSVALRGFENLAIINRATVSLFNNLSPQFIKKFAQSPAIAELHRSPWTEPIKETQDIARSIMRLFGISNSAVKVAFDASLPAPGRIKIGLSDIYFVEINAKYKSQPDSVVAILAHEVAHIFLHKHNIRFESTEEDEILTDTTAAFLGFGPSILNVAYNLTIRTGNRIETSEFILGYLTADEFGYVIARRNHYFGVTTAIPIKPGVPSEGYENGRRLMESIRSQPPFVQRGIFDKSCWWVRSFFARHLPEGSTPIVFDCQYCSQKLRIPANRKKLHVSCSTCGSTLICYS